MLLLACLLTLSQNPLDDLLARIEAKAGKDKPFTLVVTLKVKPGMEEKFEAAAKTAIAATVKEKGCQAYELHKDTETAGDYMLLEKWQDLAAIKFHLGTDHFKAFIAAFGEVAAGPPASKLMVPVK
jgi:quinol monooxygenase YgiN